jgi:hypothetical protein
MTFIRQIWAWFIVSSRSLSSEVDGVKFTSRSLSSGVPQGCIPSPLFFSMFINDLCTCIHFSNFHFYADDLQIYLSGDTQKKLECRFVTQKPTLLSA